MLEFVKTVLLMLILLNPFLVIVYLIDVMQKLSLKNFSFVLFRASLISTVVFIIFAILGDAFFSRFLQADFASFQIFGGVIFLIIGIQFVFKGIDAISILRGESEQLAGAIAMPVLIGPGTISVSVVIGQRLNVILAVFSVCLSMLICIGIMIFLKKLHDYVKHRHERLIERYVEIMGRITAIVVGTVSVEMIMQGLSKWVEKICLP